MHNKKRVLSLVSLALMLVGLFAPSVLGAVTLTTPTNSSTIYTYEANTFTMTSSNNTADSMDNCSFTFGSDSAVVVTNTTNTVTTTHQPTDVNYRGTYSVLTICYNETTTLYNATNQYYVKGYLVGDADNIAIDTLGHLGKGIADSGDIAGLFLGLAFCIGALGWAVSAIR